MNRLQKKCLFASVALHGLLAGVIVVGPAFLPRKPQPPNLPILTVIPNKLIDEAFYGGGNPNGRLPAVQPPVQQPTPPAPAPEPAPPQPTPAPQPEPAPPAPKAETPRKKEPAPPAEEVKPAGKEADDKPAPSKSAIKVSPDLTRRKPGEGTSSPKSPVRVGSPTQSRAEARAASQAAARLQSGVSSAVVRLFSNLSSGTSIEPFGPGGGGEVYANWYQAVMSLYDTAWLDPAQVSNELSTVRVKVTVARDGKVISDPIVKGSGIRALDQSVQEALDRVRAQGLPALPESATESERTFYINFDLHSKRKLG
jgi:TonB family protein